MGMEEISAWISIQGMVLEWTNELQIVLDIISFGLIFLLLFIMLLLLILYTTTVANKDEQHSY